MRFAVFIGCLALGAGPVRAQEIMSVEAFEAFATGHTIRHAPNGEAFYGHEAYYPDRKVRMQRPDGTCHYGRWFPEGILICFSCEGRAERSWPEKSCWLMAVNGDEASGARVLAFPSGRLDPRALHTLTAGENPLARPDPEALS